MRKKNKAGHKIALPKVIKYSPYFETIVRNNIVYTRDRDILAKEKMTIKNFENELKKKGIQFKKISLGKYVRYYIIF